MASLATALKRVGPIKGGALNITIVSWLVALGTLSAGSVDSVAKVVLGEAFLKDGPLRAEVFIAIVAAIALVTAADILARAYASAATATAGHESPMDPLRVVVTGASEDRFGYAIASRAQASGIDWLVSFDSSEGKQSPPEWVPARLVRPAPR